MSSEDKEAQDDPQGLEAPQGDSSTRRRILDAQCLDAELQKPAVAYVATLLNTAAERAASRLAESSKGLG